MAKTRQVVLLTALALVSALPLTSAHGDEAAVDMGGMNMGMDMSHSSHAHSSAGTMSTDPEFPSYFSHPDHRGLMYAHIGLMSLSWFIVMPVAVMLSIARSRLTIPFQLLFLGSNAAGLASSIIYNHQTPDLYETNSHHKAGWAITWIAVAWAVIGLLNVYTGRSTHAYSALSAQPASQAAMAEHQRMHDLRKFGDYRWSRDSGLASERNTESIGSSSRSSSMHSQECRDTLQEDQQHEQEEDEHAEAEGEKASFLKGTSVDKFLESAVPRYATKGVAASVNGLALVLTGFMLPLGFVAFATGAVVYGGIGRGSHVFNVLAHLIKGGIFIGYGLLTLARFCGCFSSLGWSWNKCEASGGIARFIPSAAFVESGVIALYGGSNVFLERLGLEPGTPFDAIQIEHIGLAFAYFGFGIAGMALESGYIRKLLGGTFDNDHEPRSMWPVSPPPTYVAGSVMPAVAVGSLGIIMSAHTQHGGVLAGPMHATFGLCFAMFALGRLATCMLLYLKPAESYLPSRPFTEVLASFGLLLGGLQFVLSNKDTVEALEQFGFHDALPVLIINAGITGLIMAWETILLAIKAAASRKTPKTGSHPC